MSWYPKADQSVKGNSSGSFTGGPYKGVLHTTEGNSGSGAISAFKSHNSWPHFLVDYSGKVWQFIDIKLAGRALKNAPGGVQTNTDSAIQIEVVGFASKPNGHPLLQMNALRDLMRWIEKETGVKPKGPGKSFATAYGQNSLRFTNAQWDAFDGWCGHCHVPENDHWDPGAIDIVSLFPPVYVKVKPMYDPPFNITGKVVATLERPGGFILLTDEGAVYALDGAEDRGAPNRHPEYWVYPLQEAVNLHALGDKGYYVIAKGATSEIGSAGWYAYS